MAPWPDGLGTRFACVEGVLRSLLGFRRDLVAPATGSVPWIHAAVAAHALLTWACDRDECQLGQSRCRDNVAEYCDYEYSDGSAPFVWHGEDCGQGVCKAAPHQRPFCALDRDPDPRCAESPSHPVCDDQQMVSCQQGYATAIADCASGAGYCVVGDDGALCATDPSPSEHCPDSPYATTCDGDDLLTCSYGYVRERQPCSDGRRCVITPGYAKCSDSAELDPRCPAMAPLARVCDGDVVVECTYGYRDSVFPCAASEICQQAGTPEFPEAFCARAE